MSDLIQWVALFGMVGIAVVFALEVRKWRQMSSIMGRGQRVLKVLLIAFIEALFAMMLVGPSITSRKDPVTSLLYWTICLIVGLVVIVLALFDVRAMAVQYVRLHRQVFRDLSGDDKREQ